MREAGVSTSDLASCTMSSAPQICGWLNSQHKIPWYGGLKLCVGKSIISSDPSKVRILRSWQKQNVCNVEERILVPCLMSASQNSKKCTIFILSFHRLALQSGWFKKKNS